MRPRRPLPTLKRLVFEYVVLIAVYVAVYQLAVFLRRPSWEAVLYAMLTLFITLFIVRNTRPKGSAPPGNPTTSA